MKKRDYGHDGVKLSIIGFGGIAVSEEEQTAANDMVAEAIDLGVNYFDVAPTYGDAEDKLGPALVGKRNSIFLACKTAERTAEGAEKELQRSLTKLRTDRFDLYQIHGVADIKEAQTIIAPGGCLEVLVKAKERGLARYIGFSAHSEEAAELLMDSYDFSSVLFPLNWVNMFNSGFGKRIIDKAKSKNLSMLALKALAKAKLPDGASNVLSKCWYEPLDINDRETVALALRYTLSFPITAAIPPGYMRFIRLAAEIAEQYAPLTDSELELLKQKSTGLRPIF